MNDTFDFRRVGGAAQVRSGGDPCDPADLEWNFGVLPQTPQVAEMVSATPGLYDRFPNLQGRWDGKTTVCHHSAVRKVLGRDIEPHQQPRGTCGGRAGSRALEILQCLLIVSGKRFRQ